MAKQEKYIMLHCGKEQASDVLKDGLAQGVERGLFIRTEIGKQLNVEFEKIKKRETPGVFGNQSYLFLVTTPPPC